MNLAIITSRYPNKNEPYNHMFVHARCLEMKKKGINITVFVPSSNIFNYTFEGILVRNLPNTVIVSELNSFDVIYLHLLNIYPFQKKCGWVVYKFLIKANIPFAMYVHGSEVRKFNWNFQFNSIIDILKWLYKDFLVLPKMRRFISRTKERNNVAFLFPSKWMKITTEENLKLSFINYSIIPNGIDTSLFKKLNVYTNYSKIISVRSLSYKVYDIKFTIDVLNDLPNNFTLDIYGKGKFLKEYENYIKKLKLEHRINIKPKFIDRNKLNDLYSNYGIFISTTKMDSQGVTILEAMSSGLLAVSTDNTAKPEFIIDGVTGVLGKTSRQIADKIIEKTKNKEVFDAITQKGRLSMEKIENSNTIKSEIEVLQKIWK